MHQNGGNPDLYSSNEDANNEEHSLNIIKADDSDGWNVGYATKHYKHLKIALIALIISVFVFGYFNITLSQQVKSLELQVQQTELKVQQTELNLKQTESELDYAKKPHPVLRETVQQTTIFSYQDVLDKIWHGQNPFKDFHYEESRLNLQGWNSDHPYLIEAIEEVKPNLVIEVGVWRGRSVVYQAKKMKALGLNAVLIAVDTWLGSWENWNNPDEFVAVAIEQGYPTLYKTFMNNMIKDGLTDMVVPLPLDSLNARQLITKANIVADVIHIDAQHNYVSVWKDLEEWWPVLRHGGVLVGDDCDNPDWPEVKKAFDDFFGALGIQVEAHRLKCKVRKPALPPK